jgi:hypothetical protein
MVYNSARVRRFAGMSSKPHLQGKGMGAVVIRKGGPGAGSSYQDLQEYIDITGNNPENYASDFASSMSGGRISKKLSSKLSSLNIEPKKRKNIVMSF